MLQKTPNGRVRPLGLLVAMVVISSGPATAQQPLPWYELELPGPVAGLAASLGVSPDRPRAQLALDVIRTIHAVPPGHSRAVDAAHARVTAWLATAPSSPGAEGGSPSRVLPSPLPESTWRTLLPAAATRPRVGDAVLLDRRAALLAYGLWGVDAVTRAALASRPELLATIYKDHAAAFAAFGRSIRVENGRVSLDVPFPAAWESLVGERLSEPDEFIPKLLERQRGRLAYCLDTVTALDGPRRIFLLGPLPQDREDGERGVRAVARLCETMRPEWDATQQPFVRPLVDLGSALRALAVDASGGLAGPRTLLFWTRVFEPGPLPESAAKSAAQLSPAKPEWLLRQVLEADIATSHARLRAIRFAQRRFADASQARLVESVRATRAVIDAPALALVLERIGVREAATFVAAAEAASTVRHAESTERSVAAVQQFQGAIALIDRARFSAALDDAAAAALVESLLRISPERGHDYAGALADWTAATLVPALRRSAPRSGDVELDVAAAVSGVGARLRTEPGGDIVEWEGLPYKADPGAAELARLTKVRERLGSASLDDAVAFRTHVRSLADAASYAAARTAIATLSRRLAGMPGSTERASSGPAALARVIDDVLHDVPATYVRPDKLRAEVRRLTEAGDMLLADALSGMAYAIHLGEPAGIVGLAPDAARRHSFATRLDPLGAAWDLPAEVTGGGVTWHVGGALLGLDLALAPLALTDGLGDDMPGDPHLTGPDRRTLAHGLVQMSPFVLADADRDAIAGILARGRARVGELAHDSTLTATLTKDAAWSAWRRGALEYSVTHDAESVPRLFTLVDLFWLGIGAGDPARFDAWGSVAVTPDGGLLNAWPGRLQPEEAVGRAGSGLLGACTVDATLRVVETLARLQMPAALAPGVLRSALPDLAYRALMASEGDWFGLASHARDWTDAQMDDYVAALTAAGPLVVPDPEAEAVRR